VDRVFAGAEKAHDEAWHARRLCVPGRETAHDQYGRADLAGGKGYVRGIAAVDG
jgi:hypothetical protein